MKILPQDFYMEDTSTVAKALLGKILHVKKGKEEFKARIVEVEAYLGIKDPACHTFGDRRTPRTKSMYLDGGHSYVYMIYGMYYCLNFVTRTEEFPEAVLIRGVQPLNADTHVKKKDIKTNGPGKLCKHYQINKEHDGLKLWKNTSPLFVSEDDHVVKPKQIIARPRIGVDYAGEAAQWPLRFYLKDNLFISRP
ncbi:3-methyladenine DNA glycosylase [Bdellovibrio bacteriovorus]|uniref:Putative 3-methyladenine DNA glycosylase n=1 Tax=Bdellovibrio bacteriovorus TaxID=959 RepID=A0A161PQH2_BDEBC|nr:DNA-3-methyladenine glycosylase [Bdellovibrio bacteriovorus]KYG68873.1 3-methyladenine DNA glycosylase [Bdellovibrio bacteriovorus]